MLLQPYLYWIEIAPSGMMLLKTQISEQKNTKTKHRKAHKIMEFDLPWPTTQHT